MRHTRLTLALALALTIGASLEAAAQVHGPHEQRVKKVKELGLEDTVESTKAIIRYLSDKHPVPRDEAFNQLTERHSEQSRAYLYQRAVFDKSARVRADIIEVLQVMRERRAAASLLKLLRTDRDNQALIIATLAELGAPEAVAPILKRIGRLRSGRAKGEAVELVLRLAPERLSEVLALQDDRAYEVRVALLRGLPGVDEDAAFELACRVLRERKKRVRAGKADRWQPAYMALMVLQRLRQRHKRAAELGAMVELLIGLLDTARGEQGRMRFEVGRALAGITGERSLFDDPDSWRDYWKAAGPRFDPADRTGREVEEGLTGEEDDEAYDPFAAAGAGGRQSTTARVTFHGVPLNSDRVVLIIDASGSMDSKMPVRRRSDDVGGGSRGGEVERRKLDVSKEELMKTLRMLPDTTWFNMIFFGTGVSPWQKQLMPATGRNRLKAIKRVKTLEILGRTNFYGAIKAALDDPLADTVFFLTDGGMTTEGEYIGKERLIRKLREHQKWSLHRVHTLLFGTRAAQRRGSWQQQWLIELARVTDGRFFMKPDP